MNTERAAMAIREDLKITARLRRLYDAERERLSGDRQVALVVAGDLQEDAGVRTALVALASGVQEARTEAKARGQTPAVTNAVTDPLKRLFVGRIHFDVTEDREVVAIRGAVEMRFQVCRERWRGSHGVAQRLGVLLVGKQFDPLAFEERCLGGKRARLFVLAGQRFRRDLARFDIGLVEWIDAKHGAGDCGRDLPAHELFGEVVLGGDANGDDRFAGSLERRDGGVLRGVRCILEAKIREEAIVAVRRRGTDRFAIDGNDALAVLARRFGDQLLEPRAEIVNARRGNQRQLVLSARRRYTENRAQHEAG